MAGWLFVMAIPGVVVGQDLLDKWNIHPKYTTKFTVNRTRQTWGQGLSLRRDISFIALNNKASLTKTENSAQNNFKEQRASNKLRLDAKWNQWIVGMDFNIRRDKSDNDFSRRRDRDTNLDLRLESTLNVPLLDPLHLVGTGGYSVENDLSERKQGTNIRRDSTEARGTTWGMDLGTSGEFSKDLGYNARASFSGANQTSRTISFRGGELQSDTEDPNDDFRRDSRVTVTWDPESEWRGEVRGSFAFTESENYDFEVEQTEKRLGTSQDFGAKLEGPIHPRLGFMADLGRSISDIDFEIKPQDSYKRTDDFTTELRYEPGFFVLKDFLFKSQLEVQNTRKEPETSKSNDVEQRKLRFVVERDIVQGLKATGTAEVFLRQEIYDDGSLDKDELRRTWDGSLSYSPGNQFSARVSFLRTDTEIINIPAQQATNNNTVQRNRISAQYSYDFGFPVKVSQQFKISADYTFFTFDESSNTLRRTNEVRTDIDARIGSNTNLAVEHVYRFGDSGRFRQEDGRGAFLYTPTSETLRQLLTLETEYRLYRIISITASQNYEARTTTTLSTGRKRTTERVEFSGGFNFRHQFSQGFSVEGSFRQTQSNQEDDFWMVEASLNRDF